MALNARQHEVKWQAQWIWTGESKPERNVFVRFRRTFAWPAGDAGVEEGSQPAPPPGSAPSPAGARRKAILHITADSRYILYVNGEYLGQGPPRSWPQYYSFDTYDLTPYLRRGENTLAVLVQHFGEGNFQYMLGPAGLLVQLEDDQGRVILLSDESWRWSIEPSIQRVVPRISVQLPFEEQVDGRLIDGWTQPGYDDSAWQPARIVGPATMPPRVRLEPRDIAFLTLEPVSPERVVAVEEVTPVPHVWTIAMKPYLAPDDFTSNRPYYHAYLHTQIYAPRAVSGRIIWPHLNPLPCKVNGVEAPPPEPLHPDQQRNSTRIELKAGWNTLLIRARGASHLPEVTMVFDLPSEVRFACMGERGGSPWALVGPFGLSEKELEQARTGTERHPVLCWPRHPEATAAAGEALWQEGGLDRSLFERPYYQPIRPEHLPSANVYAASYADRVETTYTPAQAEARGLVEAAEALLSQSSEWTVVHPSPKGCDVRILLDFGQEVLGYHRFEVDAPEGTILDWHNFEFIQPDGRRNLAEGMNNSFRYVCRAGRQRYQSFIRRGFQYSWLTLRNMTGPVRIRFVDVLFNSYPQARQGDFQCSDALLNRIWRVGAHTVRCCSEDTYTDCPTYEQTHWVGDARNEALIDWIVNGDSRLWYHCLLQAARSLERSPLVESHVPSSWQNILPAWSFLWMRSVREFALFTGEVERARHLLEWVKRNVRGIAEHLDEKGLFNIHAWNMFDWAPMDTPSVGVVTHQNCLAVLALKEAAELASWLGESELAREWQEMAEKLSDAINRWLWNDERQAYTDCLRDGVQSRVFSQQTQTAAYMAGVAQGERAGRCWELLCNPPDDFVKAGSPFFAFFLLEAYMQQGEQQEFLDLIRRDWGFMVEQGATTFWEMWSMKLPGGRLTRSHCHGWSGAPTFFLSTYVLGVIPAALGSKKVRIAPHPGDLAWCRGRVPTPSGPIEVQWENRAGAPFVLRVTAPEGIDVEVEPPRADAEVWVNGRRV